jgi:hypothetical protein
MHKRDMRMLILTLAGSEMAAARAQVQGCKHIDRAGVVAQPTSGSPGACAGVDVSAVSVVADLEPPIDYGFWYPTGRIHLAHHTRVPGSLGGESEKVSRSPITDVRGVRAAMSMKVDSVAGRHLAHRSLSADAASAVRA